MLLFIAGAALGAATLWLVFEVRNAAALLDEASRRDAAEKWGA